MNFGRIADPSHTEPFFAAQPQIMTAAADIFAVDDDKDVDLCAIYETITGRKWNSRNQNPRGFCLPAGTKIRMADGSYKRIEKLSLGEQVLTAEGNTGRIVKTFLRHEGSCLYKIGMRGHYGLSITAEHPFLTSRGYVKAADLRMGDEVAIPKYLPCTSNFVQTSPHIEYAKKAYRNNGYQRNFNGATALGRRGVTVTVSPVPDVLELTKGVGRILGLYMAEGSLCVSKISWVFDDLERETLAAELVQLLKDEWGVEGHIQTRRKGGGEGRRCVVNLYGRVWVQLFKSLCGHRSEGMRLHPEIASGPRDFMEAIFNAWLDGDGHERRTQIQGVTVSHELALNMYDVANAMGLRPTLRFTDPKLSHGVKSRQRRYDLIYGTGDGANGCRQDEKYMWRKVDSIICIPFQGDVYNFEVEGDNSYVAEGIAVHNCVGFGNAKMATLSLAMMAHAGEITWPGADVAIEPVYGGSRWEIGTLKHGSNIARGGDGGVGSWAAEWLLEWGILLMQKYDGIDLSQYSMTRCDEYGRRGVPDTIEDDAKLHPLKSMARVDTGEQAWSLIGQLFPLVHCSNQGFSMTRDSNGISRASGSWAHCAGWSGRFTLKGNKYLRYDNSWDGEESGRGYLGGATTISGDNGLIHLNGNQFLVELDTVDRMCKTGRETYAPAGAKGFTKRRELFLI